MIFCQTNFTLDLGRQGQRGLSLKYLTAYWSLVKPRSLKLDSDYLLLIQSPGLNFLLNLICVILADGVGASLLNLAACVLNCLPCFAKCDHLHLWSHFLLLFYFF